MKRTTTKKSAALTFVEQRTTGQPKPKAAKAREKQPAAMPEYLLEEHPELMITERLPGLRIQRKPMKQERGMS
jgi:hypothetical protein